MAVTRTATKRTTKPTKRGRTTKSRTVSAKRSKAPGKLVNVLIPLIFMGAILGCLGFLLFVGYRSVTASSFFETKNIEIIGNSRVSKDDIEKIIRNEAGKNGVWNAEIEQIKAEIEKFPYVKSAVVSRILPGGIEVRIQERIPQAIIRLDSGDFWVDENAVILGAAGKNDARNNIVLRGWDETKSERAQKDNQNRIQLFTKIKNGWQDAGIAKKISSINLADTQDILATIEDSGASIPVSLGKDDFNRRLQKSLEVVEGKGQSIESLISHGSNVVAKYRNS